MKRFLGFCAVFLFFVGVHGFSQTRYNVRELVYDGVNYTQLVRSVEVYEGSPDTSIYFILTDGRTIEVEWYENTKVYAQRGNNFNCQSMIVLARSSPARTDNLISGYQGMPTSVDYVPGRSYGVVINHTANTGRGMLANFLIVR